MIDQLINSFPGFKMLQESELKSGSDVVGWQVTAFDQNNIPLGSGFSFDLMQARKIAVAEFAERSFMFKISQEGKSKEWRLDEFPTACGFAAGFDLNNTIMRSTFEAVERWALSKWIDEKKDIPEVTRIALASLSNRTQKSLAPLIATFTSYQIFRKDFMLQFPTGLTNLCLVVFVGFDDFGTFVGSGASIDFEASLTHAIIESHRHVMIAGQARNFEVFPYNRIKHFSSNKSEVMIFLDEKKDTNWKTPNIVFQKHQTLGEFNFARTILDDWIPWQSGPINRFLY